MWYQVKEVSHNEGHLIDCVGRCVDQEATLYILDTLTNRQKWATLFHEWSHAITDGYTELNLCEEDGSATQHLADNLMPLVQFLMGK